MTTTWGILGPDKVANERRTRTLGLGAAVRAFNDLAVPGMGNVYFAKQLVLALLGVRVAQCIAERRERRVKARNIETANAIEALACLLGFQSNEWRPDERLRGRRKMREKDIPSFAEARKRSFYVTQPMRMSTIQPLKELRLVEASSERFNAFTVGEKGQNLIDAFCDECPHIRGKNVVERLCGWAFGDSGSFEKLAESLSPLKPLPDRLRQMMRGMVIHGDDTGARRRKAVLLWGEGYAGVPMQLSESRPPNLEEDHWNDIESGAAFFAVRDAALRVLDAIEETIGNQRVPELDVASPLLGNIEVCITELKNLAQAFVDRIHDRSPAKVATQFCNECLDAHHVIEHLVKRDDRALRLSGSKVIRGPVFRGPTDRNAGAAPAEDEESMENHLPIPDTLGTRSRRIYNMHLFSMDLRGSLSQYLEKQKGMQ